ncbi:retroviral-like aspartic protease 1 [Lytechinus pictus]|uniref:retroviral-like aspartic protease 1 n=1 Tax=Lytechinus pictus TaxID=7653 RepID=UPI00240D3BA8|nr:retroviral-like aspartic protease 1 [Lytechinus pictus]
MPQTLPGKRTEAIPKDRGTVRKSRSESLGQEFSTTTSMPIVCTITDASYGMYVPLTLVERPVNFLIDTGAMLTILSISLYKQIQRRNELFPTNIRLKQADGAEVTVYGTVFLTLEIGLTKLQTSFVVANIRNDGILGMDVLLKTGSVIHCDKFELQLNGETIQCADSAGKILSVRQVDNTSEEISQVPDFLQPLYEKSKENTSSNEHTKIAKLLSDYQDVFSQGDHDIGRTDKVTHSIHTTCPAPIHQRPRRSPFGQREEIEKQVQD